MSALIKVWVVVVAGALIGVVLSRDSGYVLIAVGRYSVETSLALLVIVIGLLFGLLYVGIRALVRAVHLPRDMEVWQRHRGARLAREATTRGLLELSEGHWQTAERRLVRFADRSDTPLLNYLAAARAAQLQGAHDRRDAYLSQAHASLPAADIAVGLTQAELQLAANQLEQALATLTHLRTLAPRHNLVLRLLRRLYEQLGDWERLRELLPELKRRKVDDEGDLARLERRTHRALLEQAFVSGDVPRLELAWADVPRTLRQDPQVLGDYAGYMQETGQDSKAETLLYAAMERSWDIGLVETYGLLETGEPGRLLSKLEKFLPDHPDDASLLLSLGRLSLRAHLWGKARGYLEASIARNGPVQAYRELGHLLERMHEPQQALDIYRRGLSGSGGPEPVPLPAEIGKSKANRPMLDEAERSPDPSLPHGIIRQEPSPGT
jgi:HemY protein